MSAPRPTSTVIVVGAGVIGLFTALYLRRAGFGVRVVERQPDGRAASWAAGGILSPLPPWRASRGVWTLAARSLQLYPALCEELGDATGIDPELHCSGLQILDPAEQVLALAWAYGAGLPIGTGELVIAQQRHAAISLPWVSQVRPPRLLAALRNAVARAGVDIEAGEVGGWQLKAGRVSVLLGTRSERWGADQYVLCAGPWTDEVSQQLDWRAEIQPIKGQMLLLRDETHSLDTIILRGGHYVIPRADGHVLVGSTIENTGFELAVDTPARESLLGFLRSVIPASQDWTVQAQWAGLRPERRGTDVPIIQQHPVYRNVWINGGHYRNGITLAPSSAEQLLHWIANAD